MGSSQQFSLRWNNYLSHITGAFDTLRSDEDLVDVTLSCEGKRIRAHKMLLSACSTYFRDLFKENPCQHPVIIFRNVKFEDLVALIDFMYQGEVNVVQEQLASFLTTAELLAVQGLSEGTGKDTNSDSREVEPPDSPTLPPEPEVQMTNSQSHKAPQAGPSNSDVSSPVSFFPVEQRPDSPPSAKRRKWSSAGGAAKSSSSANGSGRKDSSEREGELERRRTAGGNSSNDPVEIIPVLPNLKVEMPDYLEPEQDASSCSYSDSNHGVAGQNSARDTLSSLAQALPAGPSVPPDGKHEPPDMFSGNSRDSALAQPTESLSASDISQMLAKPGPSGENQSQDSLQVPPWLQTDVAWQYEVEAEGSSSAGKTPHQPYTCKLCGKMFKTGSSLSKHKDVHRGTTRCPVCHSVFSRSSYLKQHLSCVHGMLPGDIPDTRPWEWAKQHSSSSS